MTNQRSQGQVSWELHVVLCLVKFIQGSCSYLQHDLPCWHGPEPAVLAAEAGHDHDS